MSEHFGVNVPGEESCETHVGRVELRCLQGIGRKLLRGAAGREPQEPRSVWIGKGIGDWPNRAQRGPWNVDLEDAQAEFGPALRANSSTEVPHAQPSNLLSCRAAARHRDHCVHCRGTACISGAGRKFVSRMSPWRCELD